jgi:presenilin-like A22 family membrane protease
MPFRAVGALVGAQMGFGVLTLVALRYPDSQHAGLPPIVAGTVEGWVHGWVVLDRCKSVLGNIFNKAC